MATADEEKKAQDKNIQDRANERRDREETARRREHKIGRFKDIVWTALLTSAVTVILATSLGWLTTQQVVEQARSDGERELIAMRASICLVRFQQMPDHAAKSAEFAAMSWSDRTDAIETYIRDHNLATMLGQETPAAGAVDECADAIKRA